MRRLASGAWGAHCRPHPRWRIIVSVARARHQSSRSDDHRRGGRVLTEDVGSDHGVWMPITVIGPCGPVNAFVIRPVIIAQALSIVSRSL
jgi:hypothetical protein